MTKSHRKQGYGRAALRGAVRLIAEAGGGVVEGYPHDMATRDPAKKMSDSFLYNLTRKSYEEAGFTYVRPKGQQNCVMIVDRRRRSADHPPRDRALPGGDPRGVLLVGDGRVVRQVRRVRRRT